MADFTKQTQNSIKEAAEQFSSSTQTLMNMLNLMTDNVMKDVNTKMNAENAEKFSNFVQGGGLDEVIKQVKEQMNK
jgi:hypothetical protein